MNRLRMRSLAAGTVVIGAVATASAQGLSGQSGVSGRVGLFLPSNSAAADQGSLWLSFGIDYRVNNVNAPSMTMMNASTSFLSVSADYYDKGSYRNIPLAVNYNVRVQQIVLAAGLGGDLETVSDHQTIGLGLQVAATYEFASKTMRLGAVSGSSFFVQAKYFIASDSKLNGVGLYVGMHF